MRGNIKIEQAETGEIIVTDYTDADIGESGDTYALEPPFEISLSVVTKSQEERDDISTVTGDVTANIIDRD